MKTSRLSSAVLPVALAATLLIPGCSKNSSQQPANNPEQYPQQAQNAASQEAVNPGSASATQQPANSQPASAPQPAPPPQPVDLRIPAGTHIRVTLGRTLGSKISRSGETFAATVASPVVVNGRTLIHAGTRAVGTVLEAKSLGHFSGHAVLAIRLDSIRADGARYEIDSSTIDRVEKGKGKRTAVMAGGGGGLGALIGGLAGGGKGALIGVLAGAGAGTAGSAFTDNKEIVIPAETTLTFRLERSVDVSR